MFYNENLINIWKRILLQFLLLPDGKKHLPAQKMYISRGKKHLPAQQIFIRELCSLRGGFNLFEREKYSGFHHSLTQI